MPISQLTILAMYGELCDLADMGEELERLMRQPDMLESRAKHQKKINMAALELALATQARARNAVNAILADDPDIDANPITGRIERP